MKYNFKKQMLASELMTQAKCHPEDFNGTRWRVIRGSYFHNDYDLKEDTCIIEHGDIMVDSANGWRHVFPKIYGDTVVTFERLRENDKFEECDELETMRKTLKVKINMIKVQHVLLWIISAGWIATILIMLWGK